MVKKLIFVLLMVCLLAFMGCSTSTQTPGPANSAAPGGTPEAGTPSAAPAAAKERPQPPPPPPPLVVQADTPIAVRLIDSVNSASNHAGDTFAASLDEPISVDGKVVFPKNSRVEGRITNAVPSGRLKTPAEIAVTLTSITPPNGNAVEIETNTIGEKAQAHTKRNAEMIGGGAGVGALIGAIAGKGKGAAIGGAIGAGGGTAVAYGTGKKDIGYASETRLTFRLQNSLTVQQGKQ